jgi:hypothetical protein
MSNSDQHPSKRTKAAATGARPNKRAGISTPRRGRTPVPGDSSDNSNKGNPTAKGGNAGVGYRRPPVHSRFKPGQSGNPKGRRKGVGNFKTDLKATLKIPVKVNSNGRPRKVSTQEAMLLRLREKALSGVTRELIQMILLAQSHNNEELPEATPLSADDEAILRIFKARVLSGAAAVGDSSDPNDAGTDGAPSVESRSSNEAIEGASKKCSKSQK